MSSYTTLVPPAELEPHLKRDDWAVVDCRYVLMDVGAGRAAYLQAHVPGAAYADLGEDLSDPPGTGRGRHPLPAPEVLSGLFSSLGIGPEHQVIAYDQTDGSVAARLWWLLRYMGHERVAVLDGGMDAWLEHGFPTTNGVQRRSAAEFSGKPRDAWLVSVDGVTSAARLVDARAPARYRGESEPLDPVAGHIPGAVNHFYQRNLDARGRFKPADEVRGLLLETLAGVAPDQVVHYCGSGVTACHNLLAARYANLPDGRLYAGSWSEWCSDLTRPVATEPEA